MENKETAVEWLFLRLYEKFEMRGDGKEMNDILKEAKEMEKQQINKAHYDGYYREGMYDTRNYYNETYGK